MSILLSAYQISKSYAAKNLFCNISFAINSGEKIGLIGPNGAGKSTLLKILAGIESLDNGQISINKGAVISFLPQVPTFKKDATVLSTLMDEVLNLESWEKSAKVQELLSKMQLFPLQDMLVESLSGGQKKRLAIARELIKGPELFLLDEPTNHLDVESIMWLEEFLYREKFATLIITHDRLFLQRVSNRIMELDKKNKDGLLSVDGDYSKYLEVKEQMIANLESEEVKLKNTLRRETQWLRSGVKARTTKQKARIDRALQLKDSVSDLRQKNQGHTINLDFQSAKQNPKRLIFAENISKSYGENLVVPTLSLLITPKSRIGLLGQNGQGKTTLLKLLLKKESPNSGEVFHADNLQVAWFEQNRESLDPNISVIKTICPSGDHVDYRDTKVHIRGYLARFLFTPTQMDLPVGKLSGGEQARVLIAKLMLTKAQVLVLDEPTNDLDIATLNILQDVLTEFPGAVILVTHDRFFLDNVAKEIFAFITDSCGEKKLIPFANIDQWETWQEIESISKDEKNSEQKNNFSIKNQNDTNSTTKKKKLSFKEQKELDSMETTILEKEELLENLTQQSCDPKNISNAILLCELTTKMDELQKEIDRLYVRWEELTS